ncbi:hypothetical protein [Streptomyces gibsoniae]|uniref:Uncharacterized protein n=1 Tax=Streptomyces gibsoniae TaxID=3075529 RepID=A0ABU2U8I2_9ACTN|nr:hypothetical protein [Streptomyces sp. DSM 41699]MDT0469529.1 hypothetical protein [Streptomyces sp. DSM 41699]
MDEVPRRIDPATERVSTAIMLGCTRTGLPVRSLPGTDLRYGRGAQLLCPHCRAIEQSTQFVR